MSSTLVNWVCKKKYKMLTVDTSNFVNLVFQEIYPLGQENRFRCCNGAASFCAGKILSELGAEVIEIGNKPNGININDSVGTLFPQKLIDKFFVFQQILESPWMVTGIDSSWLIIWEEFTMVMSCCMRLLN